MPRCSADGARLPVAARMGRAARTAAGDHLYSLFRRRMQASCAPCVAALAPSRRPLPPPGRHLFKGCESIDMTRPLRAVPSGNETAS